MFLSTLSVYRVISCVYFSIFSVLFMSTDNTFQIIENLFYSQCMSNVIQTKLKKNIVLSKSLFYILYYGVCEFPLMLGVQ